MTQEMVFLGGRPLLTHESLFLGDRPMHGLGASPSDFSAWPSDLLAYRQQWEPFISAHLALWRYLNALFEGTASAKQCPAGIFSDTDIQSLDPTMRAFCASLALTRIRISDTNPGGIITQWNAWKDKSSSEVLTGAPSILKWYQDVVKSVGGPYKDELLKIAQVWNLDIRLPDLPTFSKQQELIARLEGAYVSVKGILQIAGYATGSAMAWAGSQAQALIEGLTDTVKAIPRAISSPWTWVGAITVLALVGGALVIYYVPRAPHRVKP